MRNRRLYVVVSTLCCPLDLATSASAECAWVLWQNVETIRKIDTDGTYQLSFSIPNWSPSASFASREECLRDFYVLEREVLARRNLKAGDQRNKYICLPDTVDPRGPKGK